MVLGFCCDRIPEPQVDSGVVFNTPFGLHNIGIIGILLGLYRDNNYRDYRGFIRGYIGRMEKEDGNYYLVFRVEGLRAPGVRGCKVFEGLGLRV